ncbi:ParB N-terminal domain-containing protein [Christensenellaceae bacterium OttesenSCG-928-L17]|nr:ParB N-terminal domain-containing protein [Christensenellaceae bacterium OttesenSCG-928-L17]
MQCNSRQIEYVDPSLLSVHPRNQEFFDDIELNNENPFLQSIRENGILEPLQVNADYIILAGHQRYRAALQEQVETVPVIVRDDIKTEDDMMMAVLVSNFGREKNSPIKKARILQEYERLRGVRQGSVRQSSKNLDRNNCGLTRGEVANEMNMSTRQYENYLRLLKLIPEIQEMIETGRITPTAGHAIISKLSEDEQRQLAAMLPEDVSPTQDEIRQYIGVIEEKDRQICSMLAELSQTQNEMDKLKEEMEECIAREVDERTAEDVKRRDIAIQDNRLTKEQVLTLRKQINSKERDIEILKEQIMKAKKYDPAVVEAEVERRTLIERSDIAWSQIVSLCAQVANQINNVGVRNVIDAATRSEDELATAKLQNAANMLREIAEKASVSPASSAM